MNPFRRFLRWIGTGLAEAWKGVGYWNERHQTDEFGKKREPDGGAKVSVLGMQIRVK